MLSPREPSTSVSVGYRATPRFLHAQRHNPANQRPPSPRVISPTKTSPYRCANMPGGQAVILANMHRNRSNHDRLDPREANTHSVHNYLSLAISNLPIALAGGYHRRLAHRVSPYPSAHHHQCYCACCAVRYHQVVWFAHDDYRCRNGYAPPLSW